VDLERKLSGEKAEPTKRGVMRERMHGERESGMRKKQGKMKKKSWSWRRLSPPPGIYIFFL